MFVLTFISPPGLVRPFDSRTCWTPWSVFQDGSGGLPFPCTPRGALAGPPTRSPSQAAHTHTQWVIDAGRSRRLPVPPRARGRQDGSRRQREGEMSPPSPVPEASTPRRLSPPRSFPQRGRRKPQAQVTTAGIPSLDLRGSTRLTFQRFHVLLNSLFKVLFSFPSRYLSAIGLVVVFSLRWSLPPA